MGQDDKRRQLGSDTRRRLIDAMAEALSRSGPKGVSLRSVTASAQANVAAVKYHFGSRENLIDAVLADATRQVSSEQDRRLSLLESRAEASTVREWLEAWGGPIVAVALSDAAEQRRLGRIISNAINEHSPLGPSLHASTSDADQRLIEGLTGVLNPVDERDLWFRLTVMVTVLVGLSGGSFDAQLTRRSTHTPMDVRLFDLLEAIVRSEPTPR